VDAPVVARILSRTGLLVSGFRTGLACESDGLSLTDADPEIRRLTVQRLLEGLDLAGKFRGSALLNGLIQGPLAGGVELDRARAWIAEALISCCRHAERIGVTFCLEPLNRYELGYHRTLESIAEIIDKVGSPALKILIDTFHMNIEERDICGSIRRYGGHIGSVHLADSNRSAPGMGHLDFESILNALSDVGYGGFLTVEMGGGFDNDENARAAAVYLRSLDE
jgi:sugar phosphate isomerase/epimerase